MDFTGQHILITGASGGIGRACALEFARRGGTVAIHYHENADAARSTLMALDNTGHTTIAADLSDPAGVDTLIEHVVEVFGRIDVLINHASVFEPHPPTQVNYADWCAAWTRTLATNLTGTANVAYRTAQHMLGIGGGRIINISADAAFKGQADAPAYAVSKAGLNALGQSLALAYGPHNIYVYTIAAGTIAPEAPMPIGKSTPRSARPDAAADIARTAAFLASPGAEMLTGGIIDANRAAYLRS